MMQAETPRDERLSAHERKQQDAIVFRRAKVHDEQWQANTPAPHTQGDHASSLVVLTVQDDSLPSEKGGLASAVERKLNSDRDKRGLTSTAASGATAGGGGASKIVFLDGVRGLAAILVVAQHSGFIRGVDLGASAVDIFFVLSSFLLTMLFFKKSEQLLAQHVSYRKWAFTLLDYASKRFLRVYPLFAAVTLVLWALPDKAKAKYFHIKQPEEFDFFKVLTFEFHQRYHVFWTLPLEISFYLMIPVFVAVMVALRKFWWVPFIPMYVWIAHAGFYKMRTSHQHLRPHLPTFYSGTMAAIIYVKLDQTIKRNAFEFRTWHKILLRSVEYVTFAVLMSVCFKGLLFNWVHENPVPQAKGFPFVSLNVTLMIVIEILLPSWISSMFEWSVLRFWGKISFSVYLLHSFVVYTDAVRKQPYYDKLFSEFLLILLLSTASYYAVEYPSQLLATRISKALVKREALCSQKELENAVLADTNRQRGHVVAA